MQKFEERLARSDDSQDIKRLQCVYGFYNDNCMWDELAQLFCEREPSIESRYVGKLRVRQSAAVPLPALLGANRVADVLKPLLHAPPR